MQFINGAQFLNIIFLLVLFAAAPEVSVFGTVIVFLTSMYMRQYKYINLTLSVTI